MKNRSLLSRLLQIALLALVSGCANSKNPKDALLDKISSDLKSGKFVIVYQMINKDKSTEQYADWSAYLNDFVGNSNQYKVYEASSAFNKKLENAGVKSASSYTVFLKQDSVSYFYDDVIVEPMVYMAIDNTFNNRKISDMDRAFMPEKINLN